jgi:hypothetical protein
VTRRAALVPCAALALLAGGCGGGGDSEPAVVAHVGARPITRVQLATTVQHFQQEARAEGHSFPAEGSPAFLRLRRTLLGLLVSQAQEEQAAARLGVHVTRRQVSKRLARSGAAADPDAAGSDQAFVRATIRAQLVRERVFPRVTLRVTVPDTAVSAYFRSHRTLYGSSTFAAVRTAIRGQLLAQRRNAAMQRWLAAAHRLPATYAKGFGPPQ